MAQCNALGGKHDEQEDDYEQEDEQEEDEELEDDWRPSAMPQVSSMECCCQAAADASSHPSPTNDCPRQNFYN